MVSAGGPVAAGFSALGKEIRKAWVGFGAPWRQARWRAAVDVVEDLADEFRIGDVPYDPELPAAEGAERDVEFKDPIQALCPGEGCGGRIYAVGGRFCGVLPGCLRIG